MYRELFGVVVIGILVLTGISHWRATPDKADYRLATNALPRFHLYRTPDDVDGSLDLVDQAGHTAGRLVLDDGSVFVPKDGSLRAVYTSDLYLIDRRWDFGTFGGYRDSSASDVDRFTVGLRLSPVRLFYDTTAPDLVVAKDWAGIGASVYLPQSLVGSTCSHIGIGAWYGLPFSHEDRAGGGAGWAYGLAFSTR